MTAATTREGRKAYIAQAFAVLGESQDRFGRFWNRATFKERHMLARVAGVTIERDFDKVARMKWDELSAIQQGKLKERARLLREFLDRALMDLGGEGDANATAH